MGFKADGDAGRAESFAERSKAHVPASASKLGVMRGRGQTRCSCRLSGTDLEIFKPESLVTFLQVAQRHGTRTFWEAVVQRFSRHQNAHTTSGQQRALRGKPSSFDEPVKMCSSILKALPNGILFQKVLPWRRSPSSSIPWYLHSSQLAAGVYVSLSGVSLCSDR